MGQTDKQFNALLRMLIARIKSAIEETDPEKSNHLMREILTDLQPPLDDCAGTGGAPAPPVPLFPRVLFVIRVVQVHLFRVLLGADQDQLCLFVFLFLQRLDSVCDPIEQAGVVFREIFHYIIHLYQDNGIVS